MHSLPTIVWLLGLVLAFTHTSDSAFTAYYGDYLNLGFAVFPYSPYIYLDFGANLDASKVATAYSEGRFFIDPTGPRRVSGLLDPPSVVAGPSNDLIEFAVTLTPDASGKIAYGIAAADLPSEDISASGIDIPTDFYISGFVDVTPPYVRDFVTRGNKIVVLYTKGVGNTFPGLTFHDDDPGGASSIFGVVTDADRSVYVTIELDGAFSDGPGDLLALDTTIVDTETSTPIQPFNISGSAAETPLLTLQRAELVQFGPGEAAVLLTFNERANHQARNTTGVRLKEDGAYMTHSQSFLDFAVIPFNNEILYIPEPLLTYPPPGTLTITLESNCGIRDMFEEPPVAVADFPITHLNMSYDPDYRFESVTYGTKSGYSTTEENSVGNITSDGGSGAEGGSGPSISSVVATGATGAYDSSQITINYNDTISLNGATSNLTMFSVSNLPSTSSVWKVDVGSGSMSLVLSLLSPLEYIPAHTVEIEITGGDAVLDVNGFNVHNSTETIAVTIPRQARFVLGNTVDAYCKELGYGTLTITSEVNWDASVVADAMWTRRLYISIPLAEAVGTHCYLHLIGLQSDTPTMRTTFVMDVERTRGCGNYAVLAGAKLSYSGPDLSGADASGVTSIDPTEMELGVTPFLNGPYMRDDVDLATLYFSSDLVRYNTTDSAALLSDFVFTDNEAGLGASSITAVEGSEFANRALQIRFDEPTWFAGIADELSVVANAFSSALVPNTTELPMCNGDSMTFTVSDMLLEEIWIEATSLHNANGLYKGVQLTATAPFNDSNIDSVDYGILDSIGNPFAVTSISTGALANDESIIVHFVTGRQADPSYDFDYQVVANPSVGSFLYSPGVPSELDLYAVIHDGSRPYAVRAKAVWGSTEIKVEYSENLSVPDQVSPDEALSYFSVNLGGLTFTALSYTDNILTLTLSAAFETPALPFDGTGLPSYVSCDGTPRMLTDPVNNPVFPFDTIPIEPDDTIAPTVTEIVPEEHSADGVVIHLRIYFSEDMVFYGGSELNFTVSFPSVEIVGLYGPTTQGQSPEYLNYISFMLNTGSGRPPPDSDYLYEVTYTGDPSKLTDLHGNALQAPISSMASKDTIAPLLLTDFESEIGSSTITAQFSETLGTVNSGSFTIPGYTVIGADATGDRLDLTLSSALVASDFHNGGIGINVVSGGVYDTATSPNTRAHSGNLVYSGPPPALISATTEDTVDDGMVDTVRLVFNAPMVGSHGGSLVYFSVTGGWSFWFLSVPGTSEMVLRIGEDSPSAGGSTGVSLSLSLSSGHDLQSAYQEPLAAFSGFTVSDGAAPQIMGSPVSEPGFTNFSFQASESVDSVSASGITLTEGYSVTGISVGPGDGRTVIVDVTPAFDSSAFLGAIPTITIPSGSVVDAAGNSASFVSSLTHSGTPPEFVSAETGDEDGDGFVDHVTVTFTDLMQGSEGGSLASFSLGTGWTVSAMHFPGDTTVILNATEDTPMSTGNTGEVPTGLTVTSGHDMTSFYGPAFGTLSGETVDDGASPRVMSASANGGDNSFRIQFSEGIDWSGTNSDHPVGTLTYGDGTKPIFPGQDTELITGGGVSAYNISFVSGNTVAVDELTTAYTTGLTISVASSGGAKDLNNNALLDGIVALDPGESVAPTFTAIRYYDSGTPDGHIDRVEIDADEELYSPFVSTSVSLWHMENSEGRVYNINSVELTGEGVTVVLNVEPLNTYDASEDITVTYNFSSSEVNPITDLSVNPASSQITTSATDMARPFPTDAYADEGDAYFMLVFSSTLRTESLEGLTDRLHLAGTWASTQNVTGVAYSAPATWNVSVEAPLSAADFHNSSISVAETVEDNSNNAVIGSRSVALMNNAVISAVVERLVSGSITSSDAEAGVVNQVRAEFNKPILLNGAPASDFSSDQLGTASAIALDPSNSSILFVNFDGGSVSTDSTPTLIYTGTQLSDEGFEAVGAFHGDFTEDGAPPVSVNTNWTADPNEPFLYREWSEPISNPDKSKISLSSGADGRFVVNAEVINSTILKVEMSNLFRFSDSVDGYLKVTTEAGAVTDTTSNPSLAVAEAMVTSNGLANISSIEGISNGDTLWGVIPALKFVSPVAGDVGDTFVLLVHRPGESTPVQIELDNEVAAGTVSLPSVSLFEDRMNEQGPLLANVSGANVTIAYTENGVVKGGSEPITGITVVTTCSTTGKSATSECVNCLPEYMDQEECTTCASSHFGEFCNISESACSDLRCSGEGFCLTQLPTPAPVAGEEPVPQCVCNPGRHGHDCSETSASCHLRRCLGNGECKEQYDVSGCDCNDGYTRHPEWYSSTTRYDCTQCSGNLANYVFVYQNNDPASSGCLFCDESHYGPLCERSEPFCGFDFNKESVKCIATEFSAINTEFDGGGEIESDAPANFPSSLPACSCFNIEETGVSAGTELTVKIDQGSETLCGAGGRLSEDLQRCECDANRVWSQKPEYEKNQCILNCRHESVYVPEDDRCECPDGAACKDYGGALFNHNLKNQEVGMIVAISWSGATVLISIGIGVWLQKAAAAAAMIGGGF